MSLLIDGYNLLHVTDISGGGGPQGFQRSREAFLRFLAASLGEDQKRDAVIVFDAADAPPGLPTTLEHDGITVHFARGYPDADSMLEELIAHHSAPRTLTVVSSDHRVQRAARRRKAKPIDSDVWLASLSARRAQSGRTEANAFQKPSGELDPQAVEYWTKRFAQQPDELRSAGGDIVNPFPAGYGEDLLDDAEDGLD